MDQIPDVLRIIPRAPILSTKHATLDIETRLVLMTQPLSIENPDWTYLITTRTAGSRLWFTKNPELEQRILGSLARYQEIHEVRFFAFVMMGNHYHLIAQFPKRNRALFMRDFNSAVARLVGRHVKSHGRRAVWARRYAYQVLPRDEDIRHWYYYCALNPVSSGITETIEEYRNFNSHFDSIRGIERTYKWVDWSAYLMKSRGAKPVSPEQFSREYTLRFSRLPGYGDLSQEEYGSRTSAILEERRVEAVLKRRNRGEGFLGWERASLQKPGAMPRATKTSKRNSHRPLVLSRCNATRAAFLRLYFQIRATYRAVSAAFRQGEAALFPTGTYPPPRLVPA